MSEQFLGELRMMSFGFAPKGWAFFEVNSVGRSTAFDGSTGAAAAGTARVGRWEGAGAVVAAWTGAGWLVPGVYFLGTTGVMMYSIGPGLAGWMGSGGVGENVLTSLASTQSSMPDCQTCVSRGSVPSSNRCFNANSSNGPVGSPAAT